MHRRLACLAVALLVSGCSFSGFGSPPNYGYVVITAGGVGLRSGSSDVPPNLDLRLHATGAPLQASDVTATLDGNHLTLANQNQDLLATVKPLPLSSSSSPVRRSRRARDPELRVHGDCTNGCDGGGHIDPASGLVVDAVFDDAPDQTAMAAALPGATITWIDGTHARIAWSSRPPASITLPATIPTAGESHLDPGITLSLMGIPRHTVRRVTVPAAPSVAGIPVDAFVINTAASNSSFAFTSARSPRSRRSAGSHRQTGRSWVLPISPQWGVPELRVCRCGRRLQMIPRIRVPPINCSTTRMRPTSSSTRWSPPSDSTAIRASTLISRECSLPTRRRSPRSSNSSRPRSMPMAPS